MMLVSQRKEEGQSVVDSNRGVSEARRKVGTSEAKRTEQCGWEKIQKMENQPVWCEG
jgi:hypothetical protein